MVLTEMMFPWGGRRVQAHRGDLTSRGPSALGTESFISQKDDKPLLVPSKTRSTRSQRFPHVISTTPFSITAPLFVLGVSTHQRLCMCSCFNVSVTWPGAGLARAGGTRLPAGYSTEAPGPGTGGGGGLLRGVPLHSPPPEDFSAVTNQTHTDTSPWITMRAKRGAWVYDPGGYSPWLCWSGPRPGTRWCRRRPSG